LEERLAQMAQETSDQEAASQVVELIESLPSVDELTLSDREQVESARSAYEVLSEERRVVVSSIDKWEQLEERIDQLEQETSDQEAACHVVELIESLQSVDEL